MQGKNELNMQMNKAVKGISKNASNARGGIGFPNKLDSGPACLSGQKSTKAIRSAKPTATKQQKDQDFFFNSSFRNDGQSKNKRTF